jgi:uncharacterized membrane protein
VSENAVVHIGIYRDEADAQHDYDIVKSLRDEFRIDTYDAAVVVKRDGKLDVNKDELPTRRGAWTGLAVGGLIGLAAPPLLAAGAIGAATGGIVGHFRKGMSRSDVKELGDLLEEGQASLVILARGVLGEGLSNLSGRAIRSVEKEIPDGEGLDRELEDAIDRIAAEE